MSIEDWIINARARSAILVHNHDGRGKGTSRGWLDTGKVNFKGEPEVSGCVKVPEKGLDFLYINRLGKEVTKQVEVGKKLLSRKPIYEQTKEWEDILSYKVIGRFGEAKFGEQPAYGIVFATQRPRLPDEGDRRGAAIIFKAIMNGFDAKGFESAVRQNPRLPVQFFTGVFPESDARFKPHLADRLYLCAGDHEDGRQWCDYKRTANSLRRGQDISESASRNVLNYN